MQGRYTGEKPLPSRSLEPQMSVTKQVPGNPPRLAPRAQDARRADIPTLVDIEDIAGHLGVTVRHVRRLVAERRIPYCKWGHLLRFDPDEIAAWVADTRVDPIFRRVRRQS